MNTSPCPWDIRLARRLVRPLRHTSITPNQITALGLFCGLAAAVLYAHGTPAAVNLGALLFILSAFLDHADGELARIAQKHTTFGYYFDHLSGAIVYIALFTGMGFGLVSELGIMASWLGVTAGLAIVVIFSARFAIERDAGRNSFEQPGIAGFELEDIMYLTAPVTWLNGLVPFLLAAGLGAPAFAIWQLTHYLRNRDKQ